MDLPVACAGPHATLSAVISVADVTKTEGMSTRMIDTTIETMTEIAIERASQMIETRADEPAVARDWSGARDFDFLYGEWYVHNRRLRRPLSGMLEWYEFDGWTTERPLWNGDANIEEYRAMLPDGMLLRGLALRLYEPATGQWTIHWSADAAGTLGVPVIGGFRDGVGEFHGADTYEGQPIRVRFYWMSSGPGSARWERAFSSDGGVTWETNWIMTFRRWA